MRVLVAYFTKGGASETYAKTISETLRGNGFDVELANLRDSKPRVQNYDAIVVGTGVRMFHV